MRKYLFFGILLACMACTNQSNQNIEVQGEQMQWHKITLKIPGPESSEYDRENPFLNYRLLGEFTNGIDTMFIPGYYAADGNAAETSAEEGDVWKIHFCPPTTGTWNYLIHFQRGDALAINDDLSIGEAVQFHGTSGEIHVEISDKQGADFRAKGKIIDGKHGYFVHQGSGELFIKNGTNGPENFLAYEDFDGTKRFVNKVIRDREDNAKDQLHTYKPHAKDFKEGNPTWQNGKGKNMFGVINYLIEKGVNTHYMLTMNILGDGKDVWPYCDHNERYRFDCSKLDQWEIIFDYMEKQGMLAHLVLQETENEVLLDAGYTDVQRKIYIRELTARFGHHLGILWNLGEENGAASWTPIGQTDQQRMDMANYIKAVNPYDPIVLLHTHADDHGQDLYLTPMLGFENLNGASMQVAEPARVNERVSKFVGLSKEAGKPWIVCMDELGPHWQGVLPDSYDAAHDTTRTEALWGSLMAGSTGVEWYFGWKYPQADLQLEDYRSRDLWWDQSTIATSFLSGFPLQEMFADNSIVKNSFGFCLRKSDDLYLVYFKDIHENSGVSLSKGGAYHLKWFNPRTGEYLPEIIEISAKRGITNLASQAVLNNGDWVAILQKRR